MYARDIAQPCRTLAGDSDALDAVQALVSDPCLYLVLLDRHGAPQRVLCGQEFLRVMLPGSVLAQPGLIALTGLDVRGLLAKALKNRRVTECLAPTLTSTLTVSASSSLSQVMLHLAGSDSPLAVVVERSVDSTDVMGVITARHLLGHLLEEDDHLADEPTSAS